MTVPVKSATFAGKKFKVSLEDRLDGYADAPENADVSRELWINPDLVGERRLDVCIHEALHACHPYMGEEDVAETARDIARFLYRMGYRVK